jgi:hypothetical protein
MKISFPKYGPSEFLTRKQAAARTISFVAIVFFAGVCGSYFLANRLWLLAIPILGVAGILLFLGAATAIFLNQTEVKETTSAPIEENVPQISSQWDYRPSKSIRGRGVLNSASSETSDDLSSDPFGINDNVWLNDNSVGGAVPTLSTIHPRLRNPITKPQTTDCSRTGLAEDDAALSKYD